jgi:hypothetical protein
MQVTAVSLAGITLNSIDRYKHDLALLVKESAADLVVLPALQRSSDWPGSW